MVKVITFDKGSKRRLKQIRWKVGEIVSLALLSRVDDRSGRIGHPLGDAPRTPLF